MRRRKHTTDTQQTHAHTLLFFLQREFVTRRSLRARRWSLRASRRSPDRWPRRWSRRFRHVTTSLSWDRSKRRPAPDATRERCDHVNDAITLPQTREKWRHRDPGEPPCPQDQRPASLPRYKCESNESPHGRLLELTDARVVSKPGP